MTTLTAPPAASSPTALPRVVPVLAAGTFLLGTTEFMIAGLLPQIAADLNVSVARAGLLITAFAVGMIVGSPLMAVVTLRLPRSLTLRMALAVFGLSHVVVALSSNFEVILAARFVTALATGAFWAVGSAVATDAAGPGTSSRALGVVIGGLTLANVVGVPLGSFVGGVTGWRGPFWALALLALVAAACIGRFVPAEQVRVSPSLRAELAGLRSTNMWLALSASGLIMGGVLAVYTYIAPLLVDRAGLAPDLLPLVLVGFGVGALLGTNTGGRLGDRHPLQTAIAAAAATAVVLALILVLSHHRLALIPLVALMGLAGFAVNPVVSALAIRFGGGGPMLPASLTPASFNVGIAAGSWLGGIALNSPLGTVGPVVVGLVISTATLIPLTVMARRGATDEKIPTQVLAA